jgi:hypothetical protein
MAHAMTATASEGAPDERRIRRKRDIAHVPSLAALLGAHPDALRDIYLAAEPADPTAFGRTRGLLLAVESLSSVHLLVRPAVRLLAGSFNPWRGVTFESGGTTGTNRVLGFDAIRFRCEVDRSELDGRPALVVRYGGFGHSWPIANVVDELRIVGDGIAIGPSMLSGPHGMSLLAWWGITSMPAND